MILPCRNRLYHNFFYFSYFFTVSLCCGQSTECSHFLSVSAHVAIVRGNRYSPVSQFTTSKDVSLKLIRIMATRSSLFHFCLTSSFPFALFELFLELEFSKENKVWRTSLVLILRTDISYFFFAWLWLRWPKTKEQTNLSRSPPGPTFSCKLPEILQLLWRVERER